MSFTDCKCGISIISENLVILGIRGYFTIILGKFVGMGLGLFLRIRGRLDLPRGALGAATTFVLGLAPFIRTQTGSNNARSSTSY